MGGRGKGGSGLAWGVKIPSCYGIELTAARFGEGPCGRQEGCLLAWGHSAPLAGRAKRTGPSRRLRETPPRMTAGRERSPHRSGVPRHHRLWPRGPVVPADRRPAGGAGPVGDQGPEGHVQDGGSRPGERTVFLRQDDPAEGAERGAMACASASSRRRPCSASWNDAQAPANRSRKEGSVRDHRRAVAVEIPAARLAARRVPPRAKGRVNRDCRRARFFQRAAGALVIGLASPCA